MIGGISAPGRAAGIGAGVVIGSSTGAGSAAGTGVGNGREAGTRRSDGAACTWPLPRAKNAFGQQRKDSLMKALGMFGMAALLGLAACGGKGGDGGKGGGAGGSVPAACQAFLDNYALCIKAMPEAGRGAAEKTLAQMKEGWSAVPAGAIEQVCKQALDQSKQAMGSTCPDVKWQ